MEKSTRFSYSNNRYTFEEVDHLMYQEKKRELLTNEILYDLIGNIFYGEEATISELAHYYNYSESTMRKIILKAQISILDYGIELTVNPVAIVGKEGNIRKFYFDFFYEGNIFPDMLRPPEELHELFLNEPFEQFESPRLGTGSPISAYYYNLFIALERIKLGHTINLSKELKEIKFMQREFEALYTFRKKIEKLYDIQISLDEFCWIHFQLICKRPLEHKISEEIFFYEFNLWPIFENIVGDYLAYCGYASKKMEKILPFLKSFVLSVKLYNELSPILNRLLTEEKNVILNSYYEEFNRNFEFFRINSKKLGISSQLVRDIALSFTLYTHVIFHHYAPSKKILVLLEGDQFIIQYIKIQVKQLLGNRNELIFVPFKELNEQDLNDRTVDLLLTNYEPYLVDYNISDDYILLKKYLIAKIGNEY